MSFNRTKTKTMTEIDRSKTKYIVQTRPGKNHSTELYLTPEQEEVFKKVYPITMNTDLMDLFGISSSTLHRFARSLGLTKDMKVIHKKHAAQVKNTCRKNGYYKSIKGKAPSAAAIEGTKKMFREGFHPLKRLKEISPTKYRNCLKRRRERRNELIQAERRRYDIGLMPLSDLPARFYNGERYSKRETTIRHQAKKRGYIVGNVDSELGERHVLFYTELTERRPRFEFNAKRDGFDIKAKPEIQ